MINDINQNIINLDYTIYTKNSIISEMIRNQRKNIESDKKLSFQDIKRIVKFIPKSIFLDTCSCWNGYITNKNNSKKGTYINFYFNKKKKALHRILFINYKGELNENEYIRYKCKNKGFCCSLNCMYKISIQKDNKNTNKNNNLLTENDNNSSSSVCFDIIFS